jgi:hypothetical protein
MRLRGRTPSATSIRPDNRLPLVFGRGAPLVEREEERQQLEAADLRGKAVAVRLADGHIGDDLRIPEPVRTGEVEGPVEVARRPWRCLAELGTDPAEISHPNITNNYIFIRVLSQFGEP